MKRQDPGFEMAPVVVINTLQPIEYAGRENEINGN